MDLEKLNPKIVNIYELKLHQTTDIQEDSTTGYLPYRYVTRVPGGWIYSNYDIYNDVYTDKMFVPFNNDMREKL